MSNNLLTSHDRAIVADIERSSPRDGPGIRTVVFLKGCPLHCAWCHNPECISPDRETLSYPDKCIHCSACMKVNGEENMEIRRAAVCYTGARTLCGREMTVDEVMAEIRCDKPYYGRQGGLTVSGGEPLMRDAFTKNLSLAAKKEEIHTAVETSLFLYDEDVLKTFDLIMFDFKIPDNELHKQYTGVPVTVIKEHIARAAELHIPMIARTPIIPNVNDKPEMIAEMATYLRQFPSVYRYELLPYHPLGITKAKALGKTQEIYRIPSKQQMEELQKYAYLR